MRKEEIIRLIKYNTCQNEIDSILSRLTIEETAQKIMTASNVACDCIERAYEENAIINEGKIECPNCGNELRILPKYCPYCGQHIRNGNENIIEEAYQRGREDALIDVENLCRKVKR